MVASGPATLRNRKTSTLTLAQASIASTHYLDSCVYSKGTPCERVPLLSLSASRGEPHLIKLQPSNGSSAGLFCGICYSFPDQSPIRNAKPCPDSGEIRRGRFLAGTESGITRDLDTVFRHLGFANVYQNRRWSYDL
jgi:hypothetical protein